MVRVKSLHPKRKKNFEFPLRVYATMEALKEDLECDSWTEVVRRSVILYHDYSQRTRQGQKLAAKDDAVHYLTVPEFTYDEGRKRICIELSEKVNGLVEKLEAAENRPQIQVVSNSIMLVNIITEEVKRERKIGYVFGEAFTEAMYEFLLPVVNF